MDPTETRRFDAVEVGPVEGPGEYPERSMTWIRDEWENRAPVNRGIEPVEDRIAYLEAYVLNMAKVHRADVRFLALCLLVASVVMVGAVVWLAAQIPT